MLHDCDFVPEKDQQAVIEILRCHIARKKWQVASADLR